MILHLSGDVDYVLFDELVKAYNQLPPEDFLHIYFTCPQGGMVDVGEAFIDFINSRKERISMTFYGELFSCGMVIFLSVECHKKLLKDTRGMYHFAWQELIITEGGKPSNDYGIFSMKEMTKAKERTVEFLKTTKLTEKEINQIKKGKDVYFTFERMKQLI